jgi:hypothetical protein
MRHSTLLLPAILTLAPAAAATQVPDPVRADTAVGASAPRTAATADTAARMLAPASTAAPLAALTPEDAGRRDGREAGSQPGATGRRGRTSFAIGFAMSVLALYGGALHEPLPLAGSAGGLVLVARQATGRTSVPADLARAAQARGPPYAHAFERSYRARVRARRADNAVVGALFGSAAGAVAMFVWVARSFS